MAVSIVVAFHLWPDRVAGGYVGVDVFFAISGFLITSHLFSEVSRTGSVSLRSFWARRIRRLLPAASIVLVASFLATVLLLPRALWQQTVSEIGASAVYAQNWLLGANSVDYLGAENAPTLAQHFWSLSVEEQFYIVWPLLILGVLLAFRGKNRRLVISIALGVVFVLSLAFSIYETARSQPSAFFHTGTRAWEFAAGGLLGLAPLSWTTGDQPWRRWASTVGSWAGFTLIFGSALLYSGDTRFPGLAAAAPILGAVLVIASGSGAKTISPNRLSPLRPVQVVGDLSYGIYLWHWPLIIVLPYVIGRELDTVWKLVIIVASIGLAWLSKRFVEDPVRLSPRWKKGTARSYAFGAATIVVLLTATSVTWNVTQAQNDASAAAAAYAADTDVCFGAGAMVADNGCAEPYAVPADLDTAFAISDKGSLTDSCDAKSTEVRICEYGELDDPSLTIALVGNSHAAHLLPAFEEYGKDRGWKILMMRKTACIGLVSERFGASVEQDCLDWSANVRDQVENDPAIDVVVFANHALAETYLAAKDVTGAARDALSSAISDTLSSIEESGKAVLVVGDSPGSRPELAPECVDEHRDEYDPCATAYVDDHNLVDEVAQATEGVTYVDPLPYFCDTEKCHVMIGGVIVYSDDHHLTATYARSLAPFLGDAVEKALALRAG